MLQQLARWALKAPTARALLVSGIVCILAGALGVIFGFLPHAAIAVGFGVGQVLGAAFLWASGGKR